MLQSTVWAGGGVLHCPGSQHGLAHLCPASPQEVVLGLNGGCKGTLSILVLDGPPLVAMHAFSV